MNDIQTGVETLREQAQTISNLVGEIRGQAAPNMLTLSIDPLKYLNRLPEFSGDSRELQNFIDLVDKVHPLLARYDDLSQNIFSDIIKSKFHGKAREVMEINNHITSWVQIKNLLNNNFGDRLSVEELFDLLRGTTFKSNSNDFYNEIKTVLRRLNNKTRIKLGNDSSALEASISANINSALLVFKNKLPEPMRSVLYCRNPSSLEQAMNILHEAGYAFFNPSKSHDRESRNYTSDKGSQSKNPQNNNKQQQHGAHNSDNRNVKHQNYNNKHNNNYNPNKYNNTYNRDNQNNRSNDNFRNPGQYYRHQNHNQRNYINQYQSQSSNQSNQRGYVDPQTSTHENSKFQQRNSNSPPNPQLDKPEPMDINNATIDVGNFRAASPINYPT